MATMHCGHPNSAMFISERTGERYCVACRSEQRLAALAAGELRVWQAEREEPDTGRAPRLPTESRALRPALEALTKACDPLHLEALARLLNEAEHQGLPECSNDPGGVYQDMQECRTLSADLSVALAGARAALAGEGEAT